MFSDAEVIFKYTRAAAIADGVLVDVTAVADEVGFKVPTVITQAVQAECATTDERDGAQNLRELLHTAVAAANFELVRRKALGLPRTDRWDFTVGGLGKPLVKLYAVIGPGDHDEPVATVMLVGED